MKFGILQGCALVAGIVLLAIGVGAGVTLAKTGLVSVPILSSAFKSVSAPSRVVAVSPGAPGAPAEVFAGKLNAAALRTGALPDSVRITESEATAMLRSWAAEPDGAFSLREAQVVFLDGAAEFFGTLENEGTGATVRLVAAAGFSEGSIRFRIKSITIGTLGVPAFFPNLVIAGLLGKRVAGLEAQLAGSPIEAIAIRDGFLELSLNLGATALFGN